MKNLRLLVGLVLSLLLFIAGWHLYFVIAPHFSTPDQARPLQEDNMRPAQMPRR